MKTLYEQLIENENVRKLFEQLPDDRKHQIEASMKQFLTDLENRIINPLKANIENMPK